MTQAIVFFTEDPGVLFRKGNAMQFRFHDRAHTGNSLARLAIYTSIVLAILLENPYYALYGVVVVLIIAIWFKWSKYPGDTPMNEAYKRGRPTKIASVHDLSLGQTREQSDADMQSMLLSNIREQNHYLGEDYGTPNAIDYMLGGTRPGAPNRTDALRNNPFIKNDGRGVTFYEPPIPVFPI